MSSGSTHYLRQEVARLQEENHQLKDELLPLRSYVDALQSLMDAIDAMHESIAIIPLLQQIMYNALTVLDAKDGSLLVLDEETDELVFVLASGDVEEDQLVGYRLPPGEGIAGWVVKNAKATIVNNVKSDPRFLPSVDEAFDFQTDSILAAPIMGGGRVLGVIEALNKHSGENFSKTDQTLLALLCHFAGEVILRMIASSDERVAAHRKSKSETEAD